ncbi:hypothetical protein FV226_22715 [Methylobacterium sp. WL12]|uniref:hypothetical protein n=1 Tax=Methylobacterium sp. WL12 TaxID=2603890 RepID=UPI0011C7077D|nr:hypothetical protein [Methylobacterium sp. WL12]TXM66986.1 hypothetical protein FV226_22715 [Methylobacterium sp. WL12]
MERRLLRLEAKHAPSTPLQAVVIMARDAEDAALQLAEAVAAGRHRHGWPVIVLTGQPATLHGAHP